MVLLPTGAAGGTGAPPEGRTGGGGAKGPVGRGPPTGDGAGAARSGTVGAPMVGGRGGAAGAEGVGTWAVGGGGATGASGSDGGALGRRVIRTVSFFSGTAEVLTVGDFGGEFSGSLMDGWEKVERVGEFPNLCPVCPKVSTVTPKFFCLRSDSLKRTPKRERPRGKGVVDAS